LLLFFQVIFSDLFITSDSTLTGFINETIIISSGVTVQVNTAGISVTGSVSVSGTMILLQSAISSNISGNIIINEGGSLTLNADLNVNGYFTATSGTTLVLNYSDFTITSTKVISTFSTVSLYNQSLLSLYQGKIDSLDLTNGIVVLGDQLDTDPLSLNINTLNTVYVANNSLIFVLAGSDSVNIVVDVNQFSMTGCPSTPGQIYIVVGNINLPLNSFSLTNSKAVDLAPVPPQCSFSYTISLNQDGDFQLSFNTVCFNVAITVVAISIAVAAIVIVVIIVITVISKRNKKRKKEMINLQNKHVQPDGNSGSNQNLTNSNPPNTPQPNTQNILTL